MIVTSAVGTVLPYSDSAYEDGAAPPLSERHPKERDSPHVAELRWTADGALSDTGFDWEGLSAQCASSACGVSSG